MLMRSLDVVPHGVRSDDYAERPRARRPRELRRGKKSKAGYRGDSRQDPSAGEEESEDKAKGPRQAALAGAANDGSSMGAVVSDEEDEDVFSVGGLAYEVAVAVVGEAGNARGTVAVIHDRKFQTLEKLDLASQSQSLG